MNQNKCPACALGIPKKVLVVEYDFATRTAWGKTMTQEEIATFRARLRLDGTVN